MPRFSAGIKLQKFIAIVCFVHAFALTTAFPAALRACTTAVISGKATVDGRPLLWKNRDRSFVHNEVVILDKGKYRAAAVINAGSGTSIWMGVNEAGFCIENSVTNDLAVKGAKGPGNGSFMKEALLTCATVEDFRALLERTNQSGRSTRANYGVIDAQGGAVLFETSATSFKAFDANDPKVAPHGIVVRSNFSMTGQNFTSSQSAEDIKELYSSDRFLRAQDLFNQQLENRIDNSFVIRNCMRDMADGEGCCIPGSVNAIEETLPDFIETKHTISRTTTVSAAVFHGVQPGEDPRLTTMWVAVGDPKFSVAVPCWASCNTLAKEFSADHPNSFTALAHNIRENFYEETRNGVTTEGLPELWESLWRTEDLILKTTARHMKQWRRSSFSPQAATALHFSVARQANRALLEQQVPVSTSAR